MRNDYSFSETIANVYSLIITKIFYKGARLVRRPFYCRGKARLKFGPGFTTGHHCRFDLLDDTGDNTKKLIIGANCKIGDNVHIVANEKVIIGDNCLMASKIFISDTSHGAYSGDFTDSSPEIAPDLRTLVTRPVTIGNNVWIGENVCILMGVSVGNGCILGANSVVTKSIPDNSIVGGIPARVLKTWNNELKIWEKLNLR